MQQQDLSMNFTDPDSGSPAYIGIRVVAAQIGLAVSLKGDGDVEVFLTPALCQELASKLESAIKLSASS